MVERNCPDCQAKIGEQHHENCDVCLCTYCGGQRLQCDCEKHDPERAAWTGNWPGVEACRELNWYAKLVTGKDWIKCSPYEDGATEDLNRWAVFCARNREPYPDCEQGETNV